MKYSTGGLHVNPKNPFLGASADGLIHCEICGTGLVEVKCPYGHKESQWRNMTPTECAQDISFCCELSEIKSQLHVSSTGSASYELIWVDFLVWAKKGCTNIYCRVRG